MFIELIIEMYEVFSRKIHNLPNFIFEPTERELKQIENFLILLENKYDKNSIGRNFLYNFFVFNYDYWSSLDHKGKKRIPLNWIIGKKSHDRWVRRVEDDLYHAHKYATNTGIHLGLMKVGVEKRADDVTSVKNHEELEKKRYYNTEIGLTNCIESTTLYNHKSISCIRCNNRKECKSLLKDNYPKIYIARGYLKI